MEVQSALKVNSERERSSLRSLNQCAGAGSEALPGNIHPVEKSIRGIVNDRRRLMAAQAIMNGISTEELEKTVENVREHPELGKCRFRAHNEWLDGGNNHVRVKDFYAAGQEITSRREAFDFDADEPPLLLGHDRGANPVEYLLTALSSCMTTSIVYHAAANGIKIEELESDFEGDLDLQGFLGLSDKIRPGYQQIRATFRVKCDAPAEKLEEFTKFSPVYDVVSKSVPVVVKIEKK